MRRREFLDATAALIAAGALPRVALADAPDGLLQHVTGPENLATPMRYYDRLITPSEVVFVRSHFGPPAKDPARKLRITGMVKQPLELGPDDLRKFKEVTLTAVLQCAGNGRALYTPSVQGLQWMHGAMAQVKWTGVRLADVLKKAEIEPGTAHIRLAGADAPQMPTVPAFLRSIPLDRALDPTTLLAYRMNGEPLSLAHGAPIRLIVPGWSGNHWVKWLTDIRAQKEEAEGYYMRTAYRIPKNPVPPGTTVPPEETIPVTSCPVKSLIGRPADAANVKVGPQEVVGVAFSGDARIAKVEVSTDGGASWAEAKLEGEAAPGVWQVFRHKFTAKSPGRFQAVARATDARGSAQPEDAVWNPSGLLWNGWHRTNFTVES